MENFIVQQSAGPKTHKNEETTSGKEAAEKQSLRLPGGESE